MKINKNHPDRKECYKYLEEYGTPAHVIGHCKSVAAVAYRIARTMNQHGADFDLDLVLAAGLLHDIARVEDRHWDVGADFAREHGYHDEEKIIRAHMNHEFPQSVSELTETDMVCFGDRLSLEDRYAGLDIRMDYIVNKAIKHGHNDAVPRILEKKELTRNLIKQMEAIIGVTFDDLLSDVDYENEEARDAR